MRVNIQALIDYHWLAPLPNRIDRMVHWLARRLPTRLVYWAVIRAGVKAMGRDKEPGQVTLLDLLDAVKYWR